MPGGHQKLRERLGIDASPEPQKRSALPAPDFRLLASRTVWECMPVNFKPPALLHVVTSALGGPHRGSWEDGLSECTMAVLRVGLVHNEHYLSSSSYCDFGLVTLSYFIILLWKILSLGKKKSHQNPRERYKAGVLSPSPPSSPGIPDKVRRHFLLSQDIGWKGVLLVSSGGEARGATKHPTTHREAPHDKEWSDSKVNHVCLGNSLVRWKIKGTRSLSHASLGENKSSLLSTAWLFPRRTATANIHNPIPK